MRLSPKVAVRAAASPPIRVPKAAASIAPTISRWPRSACPAISFKSGQDLVNGGIARGEAIGKDYTEKRYHQPDDEFLPSWDYSGIVSDGALLHAVGRNLANGNAWPNWSPDSEFRATRDGSAGERNLPPTPVTAPAPTAGERG